MRVFEQLFCQIVMLFKDLLLIISIDILKTYFMYFTIFHKITFQHFVPCCLERGSNYVMCYKMNCNCN